MMMTKTENEILPNARWRVVEIRTGMFAVQNGDGISPAIYSSKAWAQAKADALNRWENIAPRAVESVVAA